MTAQAFAKSKKLWKKKLPGNISLGNPSRGMFCQVMCWITESFGQLCWLDNVSGQWVQKRSPSCTLQIVFDEVLPWMIDFLLSNIFKNQLLL
jgi:hypothetical protein